MSSHVPGTSSLREPSPTRDGGLPLDPRAQSILIITTDDPGSMHLYGRELAKRLPVRELRVCTRGAGFDTFAAPLLSTPALLGLLRDLRILAALRRVPGVLHFTHHHMARLGPFTGHPFIITSHDLIRWRDLHQVDPLISRPNRRDAFGLKRDFTALAKAAGIIAVSEHTKKELVGLLGIPEERIRVVYEGVDLERFRPRGDRPIVDPYVLFVGSEHPRKNLPLLLRSFADVKATGRFESLRLVKVGAPGASESDFRARTEREIRSLGLENVVIMPGFVPDEDLAAYYTHAECFVLPSREEGFGFPPIEAMACGCPVIVSTAGALPEIGGDAVLTVDPHSREDLAKALLDVLERDELRDRLVAAGRQRALLFSWERAAAGTMDFYGEVLARLANQPSGAV